MILKVMTVYNRVDGCCEQIMTARSEARFVREFVEGCEARNKQLAERKYPQINLSEYEIRCVGDFEDVTGEITPCTPRVVPVSLGRSDGEN